MSPETVGYGTAERLTNEAGRVLRPVSRASDSEDAIGRLCSTIDGFDQGDATPAFDAVAGAGDVYFGWLQENLRARLGAHENR